MLVDVANNGARTETAKSRYLLNHEDVAGLLALHQEKGGTERGRRHGLEVLNKSAIVLITAFWEAFCEDLAAEALQRLVDGLEDPSDLPEELKKIIARELKSEQHNLSIWKIAGNGWRTHLTSRLDDLAQKRNWDLMNPRSGPIRGLFNDTIGLPDVTASWRWAGTSAPAAQTRLDDYITLRGDVAHRGSAEQSVTLKVVRGYDAFISRLVDRTDKYVNEFVEATIK